MASSKEDVYLSRPAPVSSRVIDITKFTAGFTELWESKAFHDFTLTCGGQSIKVHRAIITANSAFFKRALLCAYDEGDTVNDLDVEADPELLNLLLRFLYSGRLQDVLIEKVKALGELADQLGVPELALQCDRAHLIHTEPDTSNCLSAWSKALSLGDPQLVDKYQALSLREFPTLCDQPEFVMLPYSSLVKYLTHLELHISDEDERLEAAMTWLRYDVSNRSQRCSRLLGALPLRKMGKGFLRHLLKDQVLVNDPKSQSIIRAAREYDTMACTAVMWDDTEHITVYPASFDKPVAVISLPDTVRQLGTACCSDGTDLYVSGLGTYYDEVYCCDVLKKSWKSMNSLRRGRLRQNYFMLVQVLSADRMKTTHVMQIPYLTREDVTGVASTDEDVILAADVEVYIWPIRDLYNEVSTGVQVLSHPFALPRGRCVLTLSTDKQPVLLVGGKRQSDHSVYQASVYQLLAEKSTGWSPVRVNWDGQYEAYPGAMCNICMPISTTDTA